MTNFIRGFEPVFTLNQLKEYFSFHMLQGLASVPLVTSKCNEKEQMQAKYSDNCLCFFPNCMQVMKAIKSP